VSLSEGADRSSAARMLYTSRVSRRSCSRASCSSASICLYPTRTRKTPRCDCCSLRVLECHSSGCQRECLERENALCRLVAARLATYGNGMGVPRIFSPLILSGSLGDALHNPKTFERKTFFCDFFLRTGLALNLRGLYTFACYIVVLDSHAAVCK